MQYLRQLPGLAGVTITLGENSAVMLCMLPMLTKLMPPFPPCRHSGPSGARRLAAAAAGGAAAARHGSAAQRRAQPGLLQVRQNLIR